MNPEKTILFGSDNASCLDIGLNSLRVLPAHTYNIITAARVSDMINIAKSLAFDLVILCFRNNQLALNDFFSFLNNAKPPLLCLTRQGGEKLTWQKNSIVFTFPLEQLGQSGYINSIINSIFLLRNSFINLSVEPATTSLDKRETQSSGHRDMSRTVLELDQKIDMLTKVKDRIASLYSRVDDPIRIELMNIVNSIKNSVHDNKLWEDFKLYFVKTNPNFLFRLDKKYHSLTEVDLKYCCYLKMNMSNDDIRSLLGINQESVRTHKYRLKKKLCLSPEQSLRNYLQSVN